MFFLASKPYMLIAPPGFWRWNFAGLPDWFIILDFWVRAERFTLHQGYDKLKLLPGRLGSHVC